MVVAYIATSHIPAVALFVTDRPAFSLGHSPCPHTWTVDPAAVQLNKAPVCGAMVSTPVMHVITWITTHVTTAEGWKAELA